MAEKSNGNTPYPFSPAEFERLYRFKQAVAAGLYSDDVPPPPEKPSSEDGSQRSHSTPPA